MVNKVFSKLSLPSQIILKIYLLSCLQIFNFESYFRQYNYEFNCQFMSDLYRKVENHIEELLKDYASYEIHPAICLITIPNSLKL